MTAAGKGTSVSRLGSLDTLRGIAIVLVISFHTSLHYPKLAHGGRLLGVIQNQGVQLFFLVSAYTMCLMWDARAGERRPILSFYARRLCRIAPLYWLGILFYSFWNGPAPIGDVVANAVLVHSFIPSAINSVVPGGWSIGVEVAFYAAFPVLAIATSRQHVAIAFAWFLLFGVAAERLLHGIGTSDAFLYYSLLTQLPIFLVGIQIYRLINEKGIAVPKLLLLATAWVALALLARALGFEARPFFWLGIFLLGIVAWIVIRSGFAIRPLQLLGRLSYSMYLSHFAVLDITLRLGLTHSYASTFLVALALTVVISWISYRTVEYWSQRAGQHLIKRVLHKDSTGRIRQPT